MKSAVEELGFAQSQSSARGRKNVGLASAVRSLAQESVLQMVARPPKKAKKEDDPSMVLFIGMSN